jgi:hypothetical protein
MIFHLLGSKRSKLRLPISFVMMVAELASYLEHEVSKFQKASVRRRLMKQKKGRERLIISVMLML